MLSSENERVLKEFIKKIPPEKMRKILNDDDNKRTNHVILKNI